MNDFVGRAIRVGDKIVYAHSTKNGSIDFHKFEVRGFTAHKIIVFDQRSFGRKKRYLSPGNCVVYKEVEPNEPDQSNRITGNHK